MSRIVSKTIDLANQTPYNEVSDYVSKYITDINNNGIQIHPENASDSSYYIQIDGNNIQLMQGSKLIAQYGDIIKLGDVLSYVQITPTFLEFLLNNKSMGYFGYSDIFESYGINTENVMIKGAGNALRLDNNINGTYQGQFILETRSNGHLSLKPGLKRTEEEEEE